MGSRWRHVPHHLFFTISQFRGFAACPLCFLNTHENNLSSLHQVFKLLPYGRQSPRFRCIFWWSCLHACADLFSSSSYSELTSLAVPALDAVANALWSSVSRRNWDFFDQTSTFFVFVFVFLSTFSYRHQHQQCTNYIYLRWVDLWLKIIIQRSLNFAPAFLEAYRYNSYDMIYFYFYFKDVN